MNTSSIVTAGIARLWEPGRYSAHDCHSLRLQVENVGYQDGAGHDEKRAGQLAAHAAHDEQRSHADHADGDGERVASSRRLMTSAICWKNWSLSSLKPNILPSWLPITISAVPEM